MFRLCNLPQPLIPAGFAGTHRLANSVSEEPSGLVGHFKNAVQSVVSLLFLNRKISIPDDAWECLDLYIRVYIYAD